jgi:hypothetical protein
MSVKRYYADSEGELQIDDRRMKFDDTVVMAVDYDAAEARIKALEANLAAAEKQWNVDVAARGALLNRIAQLEAALTGAVKLCRDCDGKGGWDAYSDMPYVACPACAPFRAALVPKGSDDRGEGK